MDLKAWSFVLLAILGYGMWGFLGKVGAEAVGKYEYILLSYVVATLAFAGAFGGWSAGTVPWSWALILPVAGGVFTALGVIGFFSAIERLPLVIAAPLTALYPIVTVALSLLILGERLTPMQALGIACAVLSGVLLSR
ncbi:MAG: DMT family transporter [Candidatus Rokubacteria bacterium]|nr:DMT family transporter [Candidatus Rokubacteria bacterium]